VGEQLVQSAPCGVVESVKAVSDIISPLSGEVIEVNEDILNTPEKANDSPYNSWLIKIKIQNLRELESLLSAQEYEKFVSEKP